MKMLDKIIKEVHCSREKKEISRKILTSLPDWFGIPEAIEEYVENSEAMPFWVVSINNECVGFISVKSTSLSTAEIYVMGVLQDYHNRGIGKELFNQLYNWCKENGYEFLQVKTLDKSHPDKGYASTRKFYEAMGFKELECIPAVWGKENPCLIMIMSVK